jgi:hypothetical protein
MASGLWGCSTRHCSALTRLFILNNTQNRALRALFSAKRSLAALFSLRDINDKLRKSAKNTSWEKNSRTNKAALVKDRQSQKGLSYVNDLGFFPPAEPSSCSLPPYTRVHSLWPQLLDDVAA